MATNYSINYEDERFKNVEQEKQNKLNEIDSKYNNMINESDGFYQKQIDAAKDYSDKQQELQSEQTQLAIDEINQQKDKLEKDYIKEQKGAYSDWQKESNRYGANAEQQASSGLRNAGYSESSQVSMYNQYQSRVSTARETYTNAVKNYDRSIAQARLSNNSKLAEIAYKALQKELELGLNGFQYKNQLILSQIEAKQNVDNTHYNRWQNVLSQINTENALAEQIRQYNESLAFQKSEAKRQQKNWEKEYALSKKKITSSGSGSTSAYSLTNTETSKNNISESSTNKKNTKDSGEQYGPSKELYEKNKKNSNKKWWTNLLTILSKN